MKKAFVLIRESDLDKDNYSILEGRYKTKYFYVPENWTIKDQEKKISEIITEDSLVIFGPNLPFLVKKVSSLGFNEVKVLVEDNGMWVVA